MLDAVPTLGKVRALFWYYWIVLGGAEPSRVIRYTKIVPVDRVGGSWARNQWAVGVTAVLASSGAGRVTVVARLADN